MGDWSIDEIHNTERVLDEVRKCFQKVLKDKLDVSFSEDDEFELCLYEEQHPIASEALEVRFVGLWGSVSASILPEIFWTEGLPSVLYCGVQVTMVCPTGGEPEFPYDFYSPTPH